MVLGIDATTLGSGGFQRHLVEILRNYGSRNNEFESIKIWGPGIVLKQIPNSVYIEKISHPLLNGNLFSRFLWKLLFRDSSFKNENIDVLLDPTGFYTGNFHPYVTMSRNMLIFDRKEQQRFGFSFLRFKFIFLGLIQRKSFNNSDAIIFISEYSMKFISKLVDLRKKKTVIIHHGVSPIFINKPKIQYQIDYYSVANPFKILYVSSFFSYKHQNKVLECIIRLRNKGYPITIQFIGNVGQKSFSDHLEIKIQMNSDFVFWEKNISLEEIVKYYHASDCFIFASSCENMPNILIEAMASGLPIICSNYNPMPEFLQEAGLYFDPENVDQLESSLQLMIDDFRLRTILSSKSFNIAKNFNWTTCADRTFELLNNLVSNKI